MTGQRLVNRVVRNLEHHMVQARAIVRVADIHARALAHRVEALENLDAVGAIGVGVGLVGGGLVAGILGHPKAYRQFGAGSEGLKGLSIHRELRLYGAITRGMGKIAPAKETDNA